MIEGFNLTNHVNYRPPSEGGEHERATWSERRRATRVSSNGGCATCSDSGCVSACRCEFRHASTDGCSTGIFPRLLRPPSRSTILQVCVSPPRLTASDGNRNT
jgi:hypothetical protein